MFFFVLWMHTNFLLYQTLSQKTGLIRHEKRWLIIIKIMPLKHIKMLFESSMSDANFIYPLNTFQANLRTRIKNMGIENDTIVSQRIKRIVSITAKLQRFEHTQLSRMQDIWWIRAIVPDLKSITLLMDYYQHKSFKSYMLIRQKNYIEEPKADWYRSVHLIFQYTSSRYLPAQWVYFEFQIRTMIQHARATAVETVGTFLWQALKANQWSQEWRDYFRLVSAGFCFLEWTKIDPYFADKSHQDIVKEIKKKNTPTQSDTNYQMIFCSSQRNQKSFTMSKKDWFITLDHFGYQIETYTNQIIYRARKRNGIWCLSITGTRCTFSSTSCCSISIYQSNRKSRKSISKFLLRQSTLFELHQQTDCHLIIVFYVF